MRVVFIKSVLIFNYTLNLKYNNRLAGSHTELLSGKSVFIDMHDMDSPDESTPCYTVYHTCSG